MTHLTIPAIEHSVYINAPAEKVFAAITTAEAWNRWFTHATTIDLRVGGEVRLRWKEWSPARITTEDGGEIVELEANRVFAFRWQPGSQPTTVRFTLEARTPGTVLSVVESGHVQTQHDLNACVSCAAGWGEALTLIKFYVEYDVTYGKVPK